MRVTVKRKRQQQKGGGALYDFIMEFFESASQTAKSITETPKNVNKFITLLKEIKKVIIDYIKNKKSFCDMPSIFERGFNRLTQKKSKVAVFKSPDKIFDGFLQFLYNNRQKYVDFVFLVQSTSGIKIELSALRPLLGRIPIPFAVTVIKKMFFADPAVINNIHASISSVITDPAVAKFCAASNSDLNEFAKKLITHIAEKMKLSAEKKAAINSPNWITP